MSWENAERKSQLEVHLRGALKEHQLDGLNMIGNVEKLVGRLVNAVNAWLEEERAEERKSA